MGIPLMRFHSDRAKELMAQPVKSWVAARGMLQTMSCGDDPASNGRVETEVHQIKRRLRLTLAATKASTDLWPGAIRHVGEERLRGQLQRVGISTATMPSFNSRVLVKVKRWHQSGMVSSPFKEVTLLGPSPWVHRGWVVKDTTGLIQHARLVMVPDPKASEAEYQLEVVDEDELPRSRLWGNSRHLVHFALAQLKPHQIRPWVLTRPGGRSFLLLLHRH